MGNGGVAFRNRLMFETGVDSGITDNEGIIAVPTGAISAQPFILMNGTDFQMNGGYRFTHVFIRKMADGELIVDGAVTADKIAANSITASAIQAGTINASHVSANSIGAGQIAADAITASELRANAVTAAAIAAGSITSEEIEAGSVFAESLSGDINTFVDVAAATRNLTAEDTITLFDIDVPNDDGHPRVIWALFTGTFTQTSSNSRHNLFIRVTTPNPVVTNVPANLIGQAGSDGAGNSFVEVFDLFQPSFPVGATLNQGGQTRTILQVTPISFIGGVGDVGALIVHTGAPLNPNQAFTSSFNAGTVVNSHAQMRQGDNLGHGNFAISGGLAIPQTGVVNVRLEAQKINAAGTHTYSGLKGIIAGLV